MPVTMTREEHWLWLYLYGIYQKLTRQGPLHPGAGILMGDTDNKL